MRVTSHLAGLVGAVLAVPAFAQPADCNAVLANGAFKYASLSSNSYFQQVLYSRFLESTYQSSKSDRGIGIDIPIGEAVMGRGSYSEAEYEAKKKSIEDVRFSQITSANYTQTVVSSGDGEVLEAWTKCIVQGGGGLQVRLTPLTATKVLVDMRWLPQGNKFRTALASDVRLEGINLARDVSEPSCFRRGKRIVQGVGCRATVTLKDAWTPLPITVNATDGAADAFIPARIKLKDEREPLVVPAYYREFKRDGVVTAPERQFSLSAEQRGYGWVIDPGSVRGAVSKVFDNGSSGTNYCKRPSTAVQLYSIAYTFESRSAEHGHDGWTIGCQMIVQGQMMRSRGVADEAERLPPPQPEPGSDRAAP